MDQIRHYEAAMRRALELALNGPAFGTNPQVGAVILNDNGEILAEGWHHGSGTPHAEVVALQNLADKGIDSAGLTAVVSLEPCNHTGKTGPCSEALIRAGIKTVVFAAEDPGEGSGGGSATLSEAGVRVVSGVLEAEAEEQGRIWLTATRLGRPFVTLKWASSLDGRAAASDGTSKWISGPESRADSHRRRAEVDAILVGTQTVIFDDPELTARKTDGTLYEHQPLRVVLGETEISLDKRVFNNSAETIHLRTRSIHGALAELFERGIKHVWIEGGAKVASNFVKLGLVDEYLTYLAPMIIGGERTAINNIDVDTIADARQLVFKEVTTLGADIFIRAVEKPTRNTKGA